MNADTPVSGPIPGPPEFRLPEPLEAEGRKNWDRFCEACEAAGIEIPQGRKQVAEGRCVMALSEFVARNLRQNPQLYSDLLERGDLAGAYGQQEYSTKLKRLLADVADETELMAHLRQFRSREMTRIAWRDLAGRAGLDQTVADLSALAEACLEKTLSILYRWQCAKDGTPYARRSEDQQQSLIVIAMGKLGARELNFSSDIDLVFAFPQYGETRDGRRTVGNAEFFTRLCRRFVRVLGEKTAAGAVFRVDLRLRPDGENGPLVLSFNNMEDYYQSQGREWERYAWIKARVVAGDKTAGRELLQMLNPFVYRRYLDYGTFESLRQMKESIRREVRRQGLGDNIKLGPGGIREIEFFGQVFQLIRGGVVPELQQRGIEAILATLAHQGIISRRAEAELSAAYRFLRNCEHRLQEYDDRQTHELPSDGAGRLRLATGMGHGDWKGFEQVLAAHRLVVSSHFDGLLQVRKTGNGDEAHREAATALAALWPGLDDDPNNRRVLSDLGFDDPAAVLTALAQLRDAAATRALSREGRQRLDALVPAVLQTVGELNPDLANLQRIITLVRTIERRTTYLALLLENPTALTHLAQLTDASPWIATFLSRHPALLDELLDPRTLYAPPQKAELHQELQTRLKDLGPEELEYQIESLCLFKQVNMLRVSAADIIGVLPLMKVSDRLSDIAETALEAVLNLCWHNLTAKHGKPPCELQGVTCERGFAVVAYGKLGGLELGYGSDLDLVFLHAGTGGMTSSDKRAIDDTTFFARLGQRVLHLLTAHTRAGYLYEADMRLRPSGSSGVLVSGIEAFRRYQLEDAWTWEHQALVRARAVAGDPLLIERFEAIRREVLARSRDPRKLRLEVSDMRERLRKQRLKTETDLFDLKEGPGGLVDIEFLVQYLVLHHAGRRPQVLRWTDNVRLIHTLAENGILSPARASRLRLAYLLFRSKIHRLNLQQQPTLVGEDLFRKLRQAIWRTWQKTFNP